MRNRASIASRSDPQGRRAFWLSLALIAAATLVYAPVRHHPFVTWDDPGYITENPHVTGGLTWDNVAWGLTGTRSANWHPVTWMSHMLDVQMFGLNAGPHHITNVLIHVVNTLLLFGFLARTTDALGRSAFVAALFAVHPLHVESVAWVSERKDVLSTFFLMVTLWGYAWYADRPRLGRYVLVLLSFACGLMAKPMLVTLPFVLLLLDVWPLGRVSSFERLTALQRRRLIWEKAPLVALAVLSSIVTFAIQRQYRAVQSLDVVPLSLRLGNVLLSIVSYVAKAFWPSRLAAFYPYPQAIPIVPVVGAALVLAAACLGVLRASRDRPYLAVGWLWFVVTLIPVIGIVQVGDQSMADRYTYIPLIGLFMMVAWGIPDLSGRWRHARLFLPVAATGAVLACMVIARQQVGYWRNSVALWEHALKVTSNNDRAHRNLALAFFAAGKPDEAMAQVLEAQRIRPTVSEETNVGKVLAEQGKIDEAIPHYREASRLNPDNVEAHIALGGILARRGRMDEAIGEYREALRRDPRNLLAHYNLGLALARKQQIDDAIAEFSEALHLKPDFVQALNSLGLALATQGKIADAIRQYTEALRLDPSDASVHNNLGMAFAESGRADEAIAEFQQALQVVPNRLDVHYNLALVLGNNGRGADARQHLEFILKLDPHNEAARRKLDEMERASGRRIRND